MKKLEEKVKFQNANEFLTLLNEIKNETKNEVLPKANQIVKTNPGMTPSLMINLLLEHQDNSEKLLELFTNHEERFIHHVRNVRDSIKIKLLPTIQTKYPQAKIERLNPKMKYIVL